MRYIPEETSVVFQEVPGEVSLTFSITGCSRQCKGCHSPHLRDGNNGIELTIDLLAEAISKNKRFITNVVFFGGEWDEKGLSDLMRFALSKKIRVTLFTAEEDVSSYLKQFLFYLKTGEYIEELGGLSSPRTNQKMVNLSTGEDITYKYQSVLNTGAEQSDQIK